MIPRRRSRSPTPLERESLTAQRRLAGVELEDAETNHRRTLLATFSRDA